jgi:hypothetical protein
LSEHNIEGKKVHHIPPGKIKRHILPGCKITLPLFQASGVNHLARFVALSIDEEALAPQLITAHPCDFQWT